MMRIIRQKMGFTLIEIMVSMVISSFVIAGIYGVYTIQQRSYTVQEQVAEMQQRLRSAMDFLARDIRMAGSNPAAESQCSDKILIAKSDEMVFNACNLEDGNGNLVDYKITIQFDSVKGKVDLIRDNLSTNSPNPMPLADGVDNFEIQYFSGYDNAGNPEIASVAAQADRDKIRAVRVSMLIRSTYPDQKYTDSIQYTMGSGTPWTPPANDHFHRRLLTTTIHLRNML